MARIRSTFADQLDDLEVICGQPVPLSREERRAAAVLAVEHGLTYYDASSAAAPARGARSW